VLTCIWVPRAPAPQQFSPSVWACRPHGAEYFGLKVDLSMNIVIKLIKQYLRWRSSSLPGLLPVGWYMNGEVKIPGLVEVVGG